MTGWDRRGLWSALLVLVLLAANGCGLFVKRVPPGVILDAAANDHFIRVGEDNVHYREYPGPGPCVLLVHGFGSSTYSWEGVAPLLQREGFHVYAVDMKGFGWSDKPAGADYGPLALTACVNAWMESLDLHQVVFVGNSLGGAVAVLMSLLHPDKVGRLVLIDAGGYPMKLPLIVKVARLPLADRWVGLFLGRWLVRWNLHEVFYDDTLVTAERVEAYYGRLRTRHALRAQTEVARAIDFGKFESYLARARELSVPTLLIWGEKDKWIPLEIGRRFDRDLPDSRLVVIPDCGHVPQEEVPERTAELITGFIREASPPVGVQETSIPPRAP